MKKILFIIGILSFSVSVFAQEEKSNILFDGSSYNFIFSWKKKPTKSHWTGLGFAFSNLNGLDKENVDLRLGRSYSIDLNLMNYNVPLHYHWLFVSGLGFDWTRYHFKGNIGLQSDADGITRFFPDSEGRSYRDSKLLVYYATIPLVLEYQKKISKRRTFFINGGVEGLVNLYAKSQVEARTPNGITKIAYKDLNILPVNFRFVLRTGCSDFFSIFGYYQPYSMFQKGKGPELSSFGIGIATN